MLQSKGSASLNTVSRPTGIFQLTLSLASRGLICSIRGQLQTCSINGR